MEHWVYHQNLPFKVKLSKCDLPVSHNYRGQAGAGRAKTIRRPLARAVGVLEPEEAHFCRIEVASKICLI